jgi:hypothetical protein
VLPFDLPPGDLPIPTVALSNSILQCSIILVILDSLSCGYVLATACSIADQTVGYAIASLVHWAPFALGSSPWSKCQVQ